MVQLSGGCESVRMAGIICPHQLVVWGKKRDIAGGAVLSTFYVLIFKQIFATFLCKILTYLLHQLCPKSLKRGTWTWNLGTFDGVVRDSEGDIQQMWISRIKDHTFMLLIF